MKSPKNATRLDRVEDAIEELKAGRFVVVVDDEDRENEGDLVMAADAITPEAINFFAKYGRGLICLPVSKEIADHLELTSITPSDADKTRCNFTTSIDAKNGISTGISAKDRAHTIRVAMDPNSRPDDLVRPGHLFPIRAQEGGVLVRAGHSEAAVDLAKLAGFRAGGVICEIIKDNGEMARLEDLLKFKKKHGLKIISIEDLIHYRRQKEKLVEKLVETELKTQHGTFTIGVYREKITGTEHVVLVHGDVRGKKDVLVRAHSECMTGDVFDSVHCDCGPQLDKALDMIVKRGAGVVLYMRQEGRGIGLVNKLKAYKLQTEEGLDTVEANERLGFKPDLRHYGIGAQMLEDLGLTTIHLMTNNPKKIVGLEGYGLTVTQRVPIEIDPHPKNKDYLKTKKQKMGHLFKKI